MTHDELTTGLRDTRYARAVDRRKTRIEAANRLDRYRDLLVVVLSHIEGEWNSGYTLIDDIREALK
jgi:hypothetical protein